MLHLTTCHGRIMPRLAELLSSFCLNLVGSIEMVLKMANTLLLSQEVNQSFR